MLNGFSPSGRLRHWRGFGCWRSRSCGGSGFRSRFLLGMRREPRRRYTALVRAAWWVQAGKKRRFAFDGGISGGSVFCVVQLFRGMQKEAEGRRRLGRAAVLLYTAAQGIVCLLTAEAGIGLVGLVLHIGVYAICASTLRAGTAS